MSTESVRHDSWLTDLPSRWQELRLKYLASCNDEVLQEGTPEAQLIEYVDIGSVSSIGEIGSTEPMLFADAPSRARRVARQGDVLVSTVRTYLKAIAPVRNPPENLIASTGFAVIRGGPAAVSGYLAFALRAEGFIGEVISRSVGISYPAINATDLVNICIPAPPVAEQTQIAKFLDYETAKIDALIEKQQQLIALLKEKRQAVISHAVTKGLNSDAPMRDSGVEWLGEIPAHWKVGKFGRLAFMQEGPGLRTWQFRDAGTRVICVTNITEQGIDFSLLEKFISTEEYRDSYTHFTVAKGEILLSSSGNSWGKVARYKGAEAVILNTSTIRVNQLPSRILVVDFIEKYLQSDACREQLGLAMTGACQPNFGPTHLNRVKTPIPPVDEQIEISRRVDELSEQFSRPIRSSERAVELLQERRTALISAAVTGKIDVRGWKAPETQAEVA